MLENLPWCSDKADAPSIACAADVEPEAIGLEVRVIAIVDLRRIVLVRVSQALMIRWTHTWAHYPLCQVLVQNVTGRVEQRH
jgi:hypothetical protein